MAGFNSRAGSGDNSISVQVNAQGIARVQLRAEHSEGFSETEEAQVSAVMQMQVPNANMTVAQSFMTAATPSDAPAKSAYKVLAQEYERQDSIALRAYADTYHVRTPEYTLSPILPNFWTQWRDYRATVIALAKPDADPTTPDGARGAGSIQVTFRDWLWPWTLDYLDDFKPLQDLVLTQYTPLFLQANVYDHGAAEGADRSGPVRRDRPQEVPERRAEGDRADQSGTGGGQADRQAADQERRAGAGGERDLRRRQGRPGRARDADLRRAGQADRQRRAAGAAGRRASAGDHRA